MKQTTTESKSVTPFFARKSADAPLVVRSGVKAGAAEQLCKSSDPKQCG